MTGFGVGEAVLAGVTDKVTVEIRAVNHRFLDVRVHTPGHLSNLGGVVEGLARERLIRGRFDIGVRTSGPSVSALTVDHARARGAFAALRTLRDELAPGDPLPLSLLGTVPDLFTPSFDRHDPALAEGVTAAFVAAQIALETMQQREGEALAADLGRRLATVRVLVRRIEARGPDVMVAYTKRLADRAERLRVASGIELDAARLEQEIVLFADRIDIAEELTRLEGHADHLESILASSEPAGRRIDFLLQEMAREANTVGSKSQDVAIAHAVVELKTEIERMREQAQNVV